MMRLEAGLQEEMRTGGTPLLSDWGGTCADSFTQSIIFHLCIRYGQS